MRPAASDALSSILTDAGSAWTVVKDSNEDRYLARRVDPTNQAHFEDAAASATPNASLHLKEAWQALYGRGPNPELAVSEAIKAVEAAAAPVVTPKDSFAQLSKVIPAMEQVPGNWHVAGDSRGRNQTTALDVVVAMMSLVNTAERERHGTPGPSAPSRRWRQSWPCTRRSPSSGPSRRAW